MFGSSRREATGSDYPEETRSSPSFIIAVSTAGWLIGASNAFAACAPTVTHIDAAATSARVSWTETCPGAGIVQLLQNGTPPSYQNGKLLGDLENLTAFQNAGVVATNRVTLAAGSTTNGVRLCSVYGKSPSNSFYCSQPFAITTSGASPPQPTTLTITSTSSTPTSVTFSWSTPSNFQSYHVRLNNGDEQTVKGGSTFTYASPPLSSGTQYTVSVEGCSYKGSSGMSCTNQWVTANVMTQAAPPMQPPTPVTTKQYELKPFSAGDCSLINGRILFQSNGTYAFSAQVRTAHTTTSDYWHVRFNLLDSAGRTIEEIAEFTGPAMKDAHPGYYNWTHNGTFPANAYPVLSSVRMPGRC